MTGKDGIHQIVLNLYGHLLLRCLYLLNDNLDTLRLDEFELVIECLLPVGSNLLQGSDIILGQRQYGLSLEGNSVTHVTTVPRSQTSLRLSNGLTYYLYQQLVGITATFVNLQTAMSAAQVLHCYTDSSILGVGVHLLIVQRSGDIDTTG